MKQGDRFGRLTVIDHVGFAKNGPAMWRCLCDCGRYVVVQGASLRSGNTKSCGCFKRDVTVARGTKHGHASRERRATPEYRAWLGMRGRCNNPNGKQYADYGGRGIAVCERWDDFSAFYADVGAKPSPKHSLDRIDVNGGYEPGNVRWATPAEQARNKRKRAIVGGVLSDGDVALLRQLTGRAGDDAGDVADLADRLASLLT